MDEDIVLIPGALATSKLWDNQKCLLSERYRQHHVDVSASASIPEMAERFSEKAPEEFTLMAFSMGGYVALELFQYIPERIKRLILINSAAEILSDKGHTERSRSLELIENGKFDFLIKLIFKHSIFNAEKRASISPQLQEMAQQIGANNYKQQLTAMLNKPDHTPLLNKIQCPTLLVVSEYDAVMPPERSYYLAQHIPQARLAVISECGHLAMLEQPEKFNAILADWI